MQTTATARLIEQPVRIVKFRYEREGHSGGLIAGVSTTSQNKTYPIIKIEGYHGRALVIVSCVTKDEPYSPHPHKLVGRKGCHKGVCSMEISTETMTAEFVKLGIHCVRKKDVEESLKIRKEIKVDPFRTGFERSFDLTAVRLCFQVLLQDEQGNVTFSLKPVVSDPIYDKRTVSDLTIVKLSKCTCPVNGGKEEIILVCDKVLKTDIEIRFYEEHNDELVWEGFGMFEPSDVYKHLVIWFKPPSYRTLSVREPVKVFIQLRRPSDGQTSESLPFEFVPLESELAMLNRIQSKNLLRNFSQSPLPKLDQNVANLYSPQIYDSINPMDLPNPIIPQQHEYSLSTNTTTPYLPDLQNIYNQFPNIQLNEPSTSGTTHHLNGERICDLNPVYTSTLSSSSPGEYSANPLDSISPPTNLGNNFPFPMESVPYLQSGTAKNPVSEGMLNNLGGPTFSDMDIQPINDLKSLLINVHGEHSELRLLNLDSGELDAMNISN